MRTLALGLLFLLTLGALRPYEPPLDALGDSITAPTDSYVHWAAEALGRPVLDEAVPGWTSAQIATQYINPAAAYVVVYAGTNDIWPIVAQPRQLAAREATFDALIARVRSKVPKARLIIVTVRDLGRLGPISWAPMLPAAGLSRASNAWAAHQRLVARRVGARLLDLNAGPYYDPADFIDKVHPNARGQARIGAALVALMR